MKKYLLIIISISTTLSLFTSCQSFLNVVPDNVATLDNAFATRHEAEKFLFTCYSWIRVNGDLSDDPGMCGGDEIWRLKNRSTGYSYIAMGFQKVVSPYGARWKRLFQAIRDCNIFLDNIDKVPGMDETEKRRWIGEVKFLKAYYNFYLVRMYGPIPLMKKNLPVNVSVEKAKVKRAPVDSCFNYIVQLLDEAVPYLPPTIDDPAHELGRVTQPIALSFKAKVLVYAASPLFNGNTAEAGLKNPDGTQLFDQDFSKAKWDSAAVACKEAIDACRSIGMKLYYYQPAFQQYNLSDTMMTQLSIRNSICEKWNSGIIWANSRSRSSTRTLQKMVSPKWDMKYPNGTVVRGELSPPLKIAAMFYTENGVPIEEDKTWGYNRRYNLQTSKDSDKLYIRKGYISAHFNFDRGPRFYADLGFDGGIWYGQGQYDDKDYMGLFYLEAKYGQLNGFGKPHYNTATGYYIKKLVNYQNVKGQNNEYSVTNYTFPIMRLSGLYLLYAEALNESQGPGPEVYTYINLVRKRAGLPTVQYSWDHYSNSPSEYKTKDGLRKIIHRERLIELAFEGQRFWDLRRWKEAENEENMPITGWDLTETEAAAYYRPKVIFNQTFGLKDYFFPIDENTLEKNKNLVQNLGW